MTPPAALQRVCFAAVVFLSASCTESNPQSSKGRLSPRDSSLAASIDYFADSIVRSVPVAGLSIVVKQGTRTLVSRGYGLADIASGRRATDSTAYRIGSISKAFTAAAVLRLVESGQINIDDPLKKYLPDFEVGDVTVRQALNHTSGLPDHEGKAVEQWMTKRLPVTNELVATVLREGPARPPGKDWNYNNTGFHLLGLVVEKVSGKPYHQVLREQIAQPLGLRATWIQPGSASVAQPSSNYYLVDGKFSRDSVWDLPGIFSAGGIFSSASDLATFIVAIADSRIVGKQLTGRMTSPTVLPSGARADYGWGLRLGAIGSHRKWGHTGSARSNRAAAAHYPADSLTVVVLMNTEHEDLPISAIDIEGRIARSVLGISQGVRQDVKLAAEELDKHAGTYRDASVESRLAVKNGSLELVRVGSKTPPIMMLYQGGEEWVPDPEYPAYRFVFQKKDDKPLAIARYDNGWFVGLRTR